MSVSVGIHEDVKLRETVRELALEGFKGPGRTDIASREKYGWLRELGSSLWLDTGDMDAALKVWSPELVALTTNNTLVSQVVATGQMDGVITYGARRIRDARPDIKLHDLVIEIAFLVNAKLALSLVERFGAHVSVELHPDLGFDIARTILFGRRYYEINPDYFYVKVPLTPDGFISTKLLSEEGIPVNYTLGFSARQNYLATVFSKPRFVNVFLGRLNQVVEENGLGKPDNIGEKTALASFEQVTLAREIDGGIRTEQIAASMRNGGQVATLAGVDVLTIPPKVAGDYLEMDISKENVRQHTSQELEVDLNMDRPVEISEVRRLWEVDADFIAFTEDAVKRAVELKSGRDLIALSIKHNVNLFRDWSGEDRKKIREKGKIPDVSQWPGAPLDDLMSISALESFAKDQLELDQRIERMVGE